jgi:hypothetical protein
VFTLVVPFHADADRLARVFAAADEARRRGIDEILFCHNGGTLDPATRASIEARLPANARLLHTDVKGIGAGYRHGINEARGTHVILSASDLPFGFSDLDAYLAAGSPRVAIGSKAHPQTQLPGYSSVRRMMTTCFWIVRRLLLGAGTPHDSQGTILVECGLARRIARDVEANDYFFAIELLTLCARAGAMPVEVPVRYEHVAGASSVRVVRDSLEMIRKTWRLRRRLR